MTTNEDLDLIVNQYLSRLEAALANLPPERRRQLIESITDHISEARVTLAVTSEVALRDILDRVGQPGDIAAAALADEVTPVHPQATGSRRGIVTGLAIAIVILVVLGTYLASRSNNSVPTTTVTVTTITTTSVLMVVPNVIGETLGTAERALENFQFKVSVVSSCSGNGVLGAVTSQVPAAGSSAAQGSDVRLVVTPVKGCP